MTPAEIEARIAEIERDMKRDRWVIVALALASGFSVMAALWTFLAWFGGAR